MLRTIRTGGLAAALALAASCGGKAVIDAPADGGNGSGATGAGGNPSTSSSGTGAIATGGASPVSPCDDACASIAGCLANPGDCAGRCKGVSFCVAEFTSFLQCVTAAASPTCDLTNAC